jgi:hypothetical protein
MVAEWLLVIMVCGSFDCHYESVPHFLFSKRHECLHSVERVGVMSRHPSFKCVAVIRT